MINIGIIANNVCQLQEFQKYINAQPELASTFAVTSEEELLLLPAGSNAALVVLLISDDAVVARTTGNRIRTVQQKLPDSAIIVLSVVDRTNVVLDALRVGALGYLHINTPLSQIKEAIFQVMAGGAFMSPTVTRNIADYFRLEEQPGLLALTNREKEIVTCLTQGLSYKMIALDLGLSLDTVRFHLRNIYKKLQVKSKVEVISKVLKQELLIRL